MKFRWALLFFAFLIVLSACSGGGGCVEKKLTLEDVTISIDNQGLKLLQIRPKGTKDFFDELNKVTAMTYAIDTYAMDKSATDTLEGSPSIALIVNVYIYVFDSEQSRNEGRKEFNNKLELAKLIISPSVYEQKNVMVIYFKDPNEKPADYNDMIKQAVKNL
jgi:hypothetical protein